MATKAFYYVLLLNYSVRNSPRQSTNGEAFAKAKLFFSIFLGKKNAEAIEFLGLIKKILFSKNKKKIVLKKEVFKNIFKSFVL